jgi:flagellin-specific chaperone FliS
MKLKKHMKQYSIDTVVTHNNFNEFVEMYDATVKYISNLLSKKHIPDKEETISKIKTIII